MCTPSDSHARELLTVHRTHRRQGAGLDAHQKVADPPPHPSLLSPIDNPQGWPAACTAYDEALQSSQQLGAMDCGHPGCTGGHCHADWGTQTGPGQCFSSTAHHNHTAHSSKVNRPAPWPSVKGCTAHSQAGCQNTWSQASGGTSFEYGSPGTWFRTKHSRLMTACRRSRVTDLLLVLLACCIPLTSCQVIQCACPLSAGPEGCNNATQVMLLTSTARAPGLSFLQCLNRPKYEPRWGALVLHVCWNTSCLPAQMQRAVLTTRLINLNVSSDVMPSGQYKAIIKAPPADGGTVVDGNVTLTTVTSPTSVQNVTNSSIISVPKGGLATLNASWTWSTSMSTGNWATTVIQLLDSIGGISSNVIASPPPPVNDTSACADVITADDNGKYSCPDGQRRVYVWGDAAKYKGLNYSLTATAGAVRCMNAPYFDPYAQHLFWNMTWSLSCYGPKASGVPFAISMEASDIGNMDWLTADTNMQFTFISPLYDAGLVTPWLEMGSSNRTFGSNITVNSPGAFKTPLSGLSNISVGVVLTGRLATITKSSALFILQLDPVPQIDKETLKDRFQLVDWSTTVLVAGNQTNSSLAVFGQFVGAAGSVTPIGWHITSQLIFRDYSIVFDCSDSSLDTLLQGVAGSIGIPRYQLQASCILLGPGDAPAYIAAARSRASTYTPSAPVASNSTTNSTISSNSTTPASTNSTTTNSTTTLSPPPPRPPPPSPPAAGRRRRLQALNDTSGYCGDARIAVNITYVFTLPDDVVARLAVEAVQVGPALEGAMSLLDAGVTYTLADYSPSLYCTTPLSLQTIMSVKGGVVADMTYDVTEDTCQSAASSTLAAMQSYATYLGLTMTIISSKPKCVGTYNCLDCWPYSITQWQIVLMACAFMMIVVLVLAVRLKLVRRWEARQPVPAGQLDIHRIVAAIKAEQRADAALLAQEPK